MTFVENVRELKPEAARPAHKPFKPYEPGSLRSFLLRIGKVYPGKNARRTKYFKWLHELHLAWPAHAAVWTVNGFVGSSNS